jgi:ABC-type transport system involved in multi-copper enzyme maturation permease subunit
MMKQVDYDLVMLGSAVFGVLVAAISISDEIEGRTAITLMSKPVSRRQFLLGKYVGILLAAGALGAILNWFFQWSVYFKPILDWYGDNTDPLQSQVQPWLTGAAQALVPAGEAGAFLRGAALWTADGVSHLPGLALGFGQVMLFVAIATALATRLPMAVTVVVCLLLFFLGHLAPVLLQVSQAWQTHFAQANAGRGSTTYDLIQFIAQLLDTLLPALEYFNLGPAIVRDKPLPFGAYAAYVGAVLLNSLMYTGIALLVGLILFEDRDLA